MALLHLDSFDNFSWDDFTEKWTQNDLVGLWGDTSTITSVGRDGTNGLRLSQTGASNRNSARVFLVPKNPVVSGARFIFGIAFRCVTPFTYTALDTASDAVGLNAGNKLWACRHNGTTQVWARLETDGNISVYRNTTLLGTTSIPLNQNVYSYIEFDILIDPTVGTVDVKIDGINRLALTGQNTRNASASLWTELRLGPTVGGFSWNSEWNFDDMYLADGSGSTWNSMKGDMRVDWIVPNANGTRRDFTPSTGTDDFAVVDENPPNDDTDYLTATTPADKVTMNFPNLPVPGATIFGVQIVASIKKVDAGTAGHKAIARISGTDYLGTEVGVPSSYGYTLEPMAVKPSDSTAWSESDFNAAEFGAQKSS